MIMMTIVSLPLPRFFRLLNIGFWVSRAILKDRVNVQLVEQSYFLVDIVHLDFATHFFTRH